jgi:hypothetical protein
MKTKWLLLSTLVVLLPACDHAAEPLAADPPERSGVLRSHVTAQPGEIMPGAFSVTQKSRGGGEFIGWCDEAAGVVLSTAPGTGTASHIGRFDILQTMCVNLLTGAVAEGAGTLIAANGDIRRNS